MRLLHDSALDQPRNLYASRRRGARLALLSALALAALASIVAPPPVARIATAEAGSNAIVVENRRPGTNAWRLGRSGFFIANERAQQIKGYASPTSVGKGDLLRLYVSVNPPQSFDLDVYRLGWYDGLGGRLLHHVHAIPGDRQPECPLDAETGLRACRWAASYEMRVPPDWTSGLYVAVLTNAQRYQNYVVFAVRDDERRSDFVYQQSVTTYQAYNNYPDNGATGKSLYSFNSKGPRTVSGEARAVKVSFDRPYAAEAGAGFLMRWDVPLVRWLERQGYDVTYVTDLDTHQNPAHLLRHRAFFSTGHDEYWSREMYDAAAAGRDAGVHLAFFGADAIGWQVRFEPSARGAPDRVMVCYRDADLDPTTEPGRKTVHWTDPPLRRPPQTLVGIQLATQVRENGDLSIVNTNAWPFGGTGFQMGDRVRGIVGYEVDRFFAELDPPDARVYTLLASSRVVDPKGRTARADTSLYQARSGAWVFASGTMSWAWALGTSGYEDARLQRATANILDLFLGRVPHPVSLLPSFDLPVRPSLPTGGSTVPPELLAPQATLIKTEAARDVALAGQDGLGDERPCGARQSALSGEEDAASAQSTPACDEDLSPAAQPNDPDDPATDLAVLTPPPPVGDNLHQP